MSKTNDICRCPEISRTSRACCLDQGHDGDHFFDVVVPRKPRAETGAPTPQPAEFTKAQMKQMADALDQCVLVGITIDGTTHRVEEAVAMLRFAAGKLAEGDATTGEKAPHWLAQLREQEAAGRVWVCRYCIFAERTSRDDWPRRKAEHEQSCNMKPAPPPLAPSSERCKADIGAGLTCPLSVPCADHPAPSSEATAPQTDETPFEVYERLRQMPQFRQAEQEASTSQRLTGKVVKADPKVAIAKIESLRSLLAWFVTRYPREPREPHAALCGKCGGRGWVQAEKESR
jgi:hypothetical protein